MRACPLLAWLLLLATGPARAQAEFRQDEVLDAGRPEAWAMRHATGTTLLTGFGAEAPAPGRWELALDLGHIPRLDPDQRRVGFDGTKLEDLNKSPVFGRLRVRAGMGGGWFGELGYTPPLLVEGVRPERLLAAAVGREFLVHPRWRMSARVLGQHGGVGGDITCPERLAGVADPVRNPYGCQAASDDEVAMNYYGASLAAGGRSGAWHWHAEAGAVRSELQVQVDAITFDVHDRSRLVANGWMRWFALGVRRELSRHWALGAEVLHVPLSVRRPGQDSEDDPLTSLRLQLRWQPSP